GSLGQRVIAYPTRLTAPAQADVGGILADDLGARLYQAVLSCESSSPEKDKWRTPLWEFVRIATAQPELAGISAEQAAAAVEESLMRLTKNADPWISCFGDSDSDDPKVEFIQTWDRVRLPAGMDMLDLENRQAKTLP